MMRLAIIRLTNIGFSYVAANIDGIMKGKFPDDDKLKVS
jgi:hypothetical protein